MTLAAKLPRQRSLLGGRHPIGLMIAVGFALNQEREAARFHFEPFFGEMRSILAIEFAFYFRKLATCFCSRQVWGRRVA